MFNITTLGDKLIGVVVVYLGLLFWHSMDVKLKVQAAQSAVHLEMTQQYNKLTTELKDSAVKTQTDLQAKVTSQQKEYNAKVHNLNLRITDLSNSLSNRPLRPASTGSIPDNTTNGACTAGCNGQGLYQDDAKFLGWYAGQAEELKEGLIQCYRQYDTVKDTLDKFKAYSLRVDNTPKQ